MAKRSSLPKKTAAKPPAAEAASKTPRKKTPQKRPAKPADIRGVLSKSLEASLATARIEFGSPHIGTGGEAGRVVIGIPFPCFALEYIFGSTVFPLGRVMQLTGLPGSGKSGLAMEMMRWFIESQGLGILLDHESKYSYRWACSTVGWNNVDFFGYMPCDSIDDWQHKLQYSLKAQKDIMRGVPRGTGIGMTYPFLLVLDSILGKLTDEAQQKISKQGHVTRDYSIEAASVTKFMQFVPQRIDKWPFSFVYVNHLKEKADTATGRMMRHFAGGTGQKYQQSFDLQVNRKRKLRTTKYDGLHIELRLHKNCIGDDNRRMEVQVRWREEPVDPNNVEGEWRQLTKWHWNPSTINLLANHMQDEHKARVRGIVDLQVSQTNDTVWSKRLGISKESPVTIEEGGQILHENVEVMRDLRHALGIGEFTAFEPGADYRKQLGLVRQKIDKKISEIRDDK